MEEDVEIKIIVFCFENVRGVSCDSIHCGSNWHEGTVFFLHSLLLASLALPLGANNVGASSPDLSGNPLQTLGYSKGYHGAFGWG